MLPMVAIASWKLNFIVWTGVTSVVGGLVWFGRWREDENVWRRKQKKVSHQKLFISIIVGESIIIMMF